MIMAYHYIFLKYHGTAVFQTSEKVQSVVISISYQRDVKAGISQLVERTRV